mmetsp:Transcript_2503/g.4777  ORF Transcript_2503/g.4777 Transcript_2503/m.4777 type:complete len:189 (+) Transcript_2503:3-569(+)
MEVEPCDSAFRDFLNELSPKQLEDACIAQQPWLDTFLCQPVEQKLPPPSTPALSPSLGDPEAKIPCGVESHKHLKCTSYRPFLHLRCNECNGPLCFPKTYDVEVRRRRLCCFKYFLKKLRDAKFRETCKREFRVSQKFLNKVRNTITRKVNRLHKGFGTCTCAEAVVMAADGLKRHKENCANWHRMKK